MVKHIHTMEWLPHCTCTLSSVSLPWNRLFFGYSFPLGRWTCIRNIVSHGIGQDSKKSLQIASKGMGPRVKNKSATFGGAWTFLPAIPSCTRHHTQMYQHYLSKRRRSRRSGCWFNKQKKKKTIGVTRTTWRVNSAEPKSLICPLFPTRMMINNIPITDINIYDAWDLIFSDQRLFCSASKSWFAKATIGSSTLPTTFPWQYPHPYPSKYWWGV